jgi:hypothetical protein
MHQWMRQFGPSAQVVALRGAIVEATHAVLAPFRRMSVISAG